MKAVFVPVFVLLATSCLADDRATTFAIGDSTVRIVSDVSVTGGGRTVHTSLAAGTRLAALKVIDRATGERIRATPMGDRVEFEVGGTSEAEPRVRIEEEANAVDYWQSHGAGFVFTAFLPPGSNEIVLPAGYDVTTSSLAAQIGQSDGVTKVGVIVAGDTPTKIAIGALKTNVGTSAPVAGSFRAEDERRVVYWLDEPGQHALHLSLDLIATDVGQTHVFSVLRPDDHITNPSAVDVDTGRRLQSQLLSAADAAKLPGAPKTLAPNAVVMVVSLAMPIQVGATRRIRFFQSAVDDQGYRLLPDGQLRWDRFLARLRTRIVLPAGWTVSSIDQPAQIGRDDQNRQTLDFLHPSGDSPKLTLIAHLVK